MIFDSVMECIGKTPCLRLNVANGFVYAKAEFMNPGGSIKDRAAARILDRAEQEGLLKPGMRIMEASSGNMGISLAMAGAARGYKVTIFMPEGASAERRNLLKLLGVDLVLTPSKESVGGAVAALQKATQGHTDCFVPNQFANPENVQAHYYGTGHEIWKDMDGHVDCFISGIGSGGTLMGVGKYLKEHNPNLHLVAAEPKGAAALLGHGPKEHSIEGIGDGFLPDLVDPSLVDTVLEIDDKIAVEQALKLARTKGILVGISAGANLAAAVLILKEHPEWQVATILPDRAERYFSTVLFDQAD